MVGGVGEEEFFARRADFRVLWIRLLDAVGLVDDPEPQTRGPVRIAPACQHDATQLSRFAYKLDGIDVRICF